MSEGFEDPYIDEIPEEVYEDLFTFDVDMGIIQGEFNLNDYFFTLFTFFLKDHNPQADDKSIKKWARILATRASDHFSRSLSVKINEAIDELFKETVYQSARTSGLEMNLPINKDDAIKARKKGEQSLKERLEVKRGGSEPDYNLSKLSEYYKEVYPKWQDAKTIYRKNKAHPDWRTMIKSVHSDLPDDIIGSLALRGASSPSGLALEHAARMCGVPPHYYTVRHLRNLHGKQTSEVENPPLEFTKNQSL